MTHLKFVKFLAIGCTHGVLLDEHAFQAVIRFKRAWKPKINIHLGDVADFAAFRSGAKGTKDEASQLGPDLLGGVRVIKEFSPTDVLIGNHEDRIWNLSNHQNAVVAKAAMACKQEFLAACEAVHVKRIIDHYDINRSWITLGDAKLLHGFGMGGENALRDHAEHFGKSVVAHFHRAEMAGGRRSDHAVCYCVGTLANIPMMDYAKTRRATARWSHGFVYGETNGKETRIWLSQCEQGQAKHWPLPL